MEMELKMGSGDLQFPQSVVPFSQVSSFVIAWCGSIKKSHLSSESDKLFVLRSFEYSTRTEDLHACQVTLEISIPLS